MNIRHSTSPAVFDTPVLRRIADLMPDLPPALRTVADYVLRHPLKAATMTIEDLGAASGTSPAAVNRMARAVDCGGFSGLKSELVTTLQNVVSPVDKLKTKLAERPSGRYGLNEMLDAGIDNLRAAASATAEETFSAAVDKLAAARRVYALGFGISSYLAAAMASGLVPYCGEATAVSMEGGNEQAAYRLTPIGPQDVLVAISLPRYSLATVQLARFAAERGATVIAITDSPASPLQGVSHHVLYAPAEHPLLTSSSVVAMTIVESLISAVMARNKEAVRISADLTESVLTYLYVSEESHKPSRHARTERAAPASKNGKKPRG